jgi:DNA (cytosine-5)-methyltransferase 1
VFVVGCLGDWTRAAQVLFERESVQRDSSPRRAKGQGVASDVEGGVGAGIHETVGALCADTHPGAYSGQDAYTGRLIPQPIGYRWQNNRDGLQQDDAVAAMRASTGGSGFHEMNHPVVVAFPIDTQNMTEGHSSGGLGFGHLGDPSFTVTKGHSHAVAFSSNMSEPDWQIDGSTPTIKVGSGLGIPSPPAVAFQQNQSGEVRCGNIAGTVATNSHASGRNTPMAMQAMTVRRLTPRECERLQGFPDDYTLIPWRKKQAEDCPDGPRYKALGNSMATNVVTWIGERIQAYETETKVRAAQTMDSRGNPSA